MIHIGDYDLEKRSKGKDLNVIKTEVHPKYAGLAYYDVAILTTQKVEFSRDINPICIPEEEFHDKEYYEQHAMQLLGMKKLNLNLLIIT